MTINNPGRIGKEMRRMRFITFAGILLLLNQQSFSQLYLASDPLYTLKFIDEFDSLGLNHNRWYAHWPWGYNMWNANKVHTCLNVGFQGDSVDVAFNFDDWDNRQFDTAGTGKQVMIFWKEDFNAQVLKLISCPPNGPCDSIVGCFNNLCWGDSIVPFKFSGAMMKSKTRFKYGYLEMKFKLSNISPGPRNSYGPNFWMWAGGTSPSYSEIDIFEQRGEDWKMGPNFHYQLNASSPFYHAVGDSITPFKPYAPQMFPEGNGGYNGGTWHTVGCEWTPDYTDFYYDTNDTVRRFSVSLLPVNQLNPMPIIVDCYAPALQYCIRNDTSTIFPFNYEIDYIKVYQINQIPNCQATSGNFSSGFPVNTYNSLLYRDVTVCGNGSGIMNAGDFHIAGQDFVLLQEGFEVNGNATVTISCLKCQPDQVNACCGDTEDSSNVKYFIDNLKLAKSQNNGK